MRGVPWRGTAKRDVKRWCWHKDAISYTLVERIGQYRRHAITRGTAAGARNGCWAGLP